MSIVHACHLALHCVSRSDYTINKRLKIQKHMTKGRHIRAKTAGFILLSGQGVYPPYTLSGLTTKKKHFFYVCLP